MTYIEACKRIMKANKLTYQEVADRCGVTTSALYQNFGKHRNITYNKLLRLADALGYALILRDKERGFEVVLSPTDEESFFEKHR